MQPRGAPGQAGRAAQRQIARQASVVYDFAMPAKKFEILVLNSISPAGLKRFPAEAYRIVKDAAHPDAILVRSHEMNAMKIPDTVRAIGRAGAGTNNIPVKDIDRKSTRLNSSHGYIADAALCLKK